MKLLVVRHFCRSQNPTHFQNLQKNPQAFPTKAYRLKNNAAKMKENIMTDQNGQLPARGIKHWGLSVYQNFLPRISFGVTGWVSSPQSPTISYRQSSAVIQKN